MLRSLEINLKCNYDEDVLLLLDRIIVIVVIVFEE